MTRNSKGQFTKAVSRPVEAQTAIVTLTLLAVVFGAAVQVQPSIIPTLFPGM